MCIYIYTLDMQALIILLKFWLCKMAGLQYEWTGKYF